MAAHVGSGIKVLVIAAQARDLRDRDRLARQLTVCELYVHRDPDLALEWVDQLSEDMRWRDSPPEIRQLGRTMRKWRT